MRLLTLLLPLALAACAFTAERSPQTLRALPAGLRQAVASVALAGQVWQAVQAVPLP